MMVMTSQFAQLAKLSGEKTWRTNNGLYLKDLSGMFATLLATLGNQAGLSCVIDDDFSRWYVEEQDCKDAPIEDTLQLAEKDAKRPKLTVATLELDESATWAAAYATAELFKFIKPMAK